MMTLQFCFSSGVLIGEELVVELSYHTHLLGIVWWMEGRERLVEEAYSLVSLKEAQYYLQGCHGHALRL